MTKNYYITTTLPYVNAKPHIGFALEIIQADALARYHTFLGERVVFNTGTDEHGVKIYRKALEEKKDPQAYCDEYAAKFDALKTSLNLSYTNFIRTTDEYHIKAAQEFWMKCFDNGDIYKKEYSVKYCVGCELEKTDSELVDGKCPVHPNLELELIEEENYFFRFSAYQEKLLALYETQKDFVVPEHRFNEIKAFVKRGLQDFSISRLKEKMPWGVEVPNDSEHVMYVWFDALVNYISTIGWPNDMKQYESLWPGVQVAGKDNLRQQTAMWQAMLMSAGLPNSKQVFIHGFINSGGQKMSKSLGNVIDPFEIVEKYGADPLRYYLLGGLPSYDDGDFTAEKFEEFYTAHLVNGVGNLTSRILTMIEKYNNSQLPNSKFEEPIYRSNPVEASIITYPDSDEEKISLYSFNSVNSFWQYYKKALEDYNFERAVFLTNELVTCLDTLISNEKPWEKAKNGEDISGLLYQLAEGLRHIAIALLPIIPESAEKILNQLGIDVEHLESLDVEKEWSRLEPGTEIKKGEILFPRLEK